MECKRKTPRKKLMEQWKHSTTTNPTLQQAVLIRNHSIATFILLFQHFLFFLSFTILLLPFLLTISCSLFISSTLHAMNKSFHPAHCEAHNEEMNEETNKTLSALEIILGDRGGSVVKVLCYKSEVPVSIPDGVIGSFHWHKILPITLWPWDWLSL